ncbi:hypothetical protein GWK47_015336 [Chionoecetes opilio]|uniref:Uncharacterized protein n=1 Tax=Chionoecetes opilio TaxID=41210 RepID=A0A8J5CK67_CHIOP|nr:hypothetical protein GWK47_015336 [Chionoecetes opilio]
MAELGSVKKRSAEVDVENRRSFSLALMTLFDIGHADAFDLITVDEDRQFLLGQRCPDGPVASCKESTNPWPTESDASGARRAKAVELTGACHDCHAQLIGLGCRRRRRERW